MSPVNTKLPINVLMMAYNTEQFLEAAVRSIISCVDSVTIIEGGWAQGAGWSSDRTWDIALDLEQKFAPALRSWQWKQKSIEEYCSMCECSPAQKLILERAVNHPYYDGYALQQQLMARDWGLRIIKARHSEDPGWLFIVDSDEIYDPNEVLAAQAFIEIMGDSHDMFAIQAKTFYFDFNHYAEEWYRRVLRIKSGAFFSDDNSLEWDGGELKNSLNIDPSIIQMWHYGYIGVERVEKKLQMWKQEDVAAWREKHFDRLRGNVPYQGETVHLFEKKNPGYVNYRLKEFHGDHPLMVRELCCE